MDIFEQLYTVLLDAARSGRRAALRDDRLKTFMPHLAALSAKAPAVRPLYTALMRYINAEQDELLLAACTEILHRLRLSLYAAAPAPADYTPLETRSATEDVLSYRRLQAIRAAIAAGLPSETLTQALSDGTAADTRLLSDWLDALESRSLRPQAIRALSQMGGHAYPVMLARMDNLSPEGRCALLDAVAAGFPQKEALEVLRGCAAADAAVRPQALGLIATLSRDNADALFVASYTKDEDSAEAALAALGRIDTPTAGRLLLGYAEDCLHAQNFLALRVAGKHLSQRRDTENRQAYYAFFTRLLPLLICRPGNHIWLVQTCIDAIIDLGGDDGAVYLEDMLRLAEMRALA